MSRTCSPLMTHVSDHFLAFRESARQVSSMRLRCSSDYAVIRRHRWRDEDRKTPVLA
ncbi:hypothetical protein K523DRAFT_112163 [Schizophyllum commune Tattone D]|nr:hypothetical protein K523DRAFT_112163 [Schizophyllum commune Tattone D]